VPARPLRVASALLRYAAAYFEDVSPLREARSITELQEWANRHPRVLEPAFGFNGDVLRARIIAEVFRAAGCSVFVETGSYLGSTALLAARLFRCPVHTSEVITRFWLMARARCVPFPAIHVVRGDCRRFLSGLRGPLSDATPFIYLDAHWYADLPLEEELALIASSWPRCVVVIDDFEVPGDPGFGFDRYDGKALSIERICARWRENPSAGPTIYFPNYRAREELGPKRRGYVVLVFGEGSGLARAEAFPLNLLVEHPQTEAHCGSPS
jgi:hypothetical protein